MGRFTIPDAKAPEESAVAPADDVEPVIAEPPQEPVVAEKVTPVEPPMKAPVADKAPAPAPRKTFEQWAVELHPVAIDDRGRASGVKDGVRLRGGTKAAAFINATRSSLRVPLGRSMTRTEFDEMLQATKAIEVK